MNASIYVGTYAKYNNGSIAGAWMGLDDYTDKAEFLEAAHELHNDEDDPEMMFLDWEGIPDKFICESGLSDEFFNYMDTITSSYLDAEVFEAAADLDIETDMVEELYQGEYSSDEDFAEDFAEQLGYINETLQWPHSCIDWKRAARDLMYDYGESDGHYFRTSY